MSCIRGSIALSEALRHVFLPKTYGHTILKAPSFLLLPRLSRNAGTFNNRFPPRYDASPVDPKKFGPAGAITQVKDEAIESPKVCVIDAKGILGPPQSKAAVLNSFDRKEYFLVQISEDEIGIPVCKIVSRERLYAQEKASNSRSKKGQSDTKMMEIPWKAAEGDVDRKLKIAKDLLDEDKKVDVVIIARRPREIVKDLAAAQRIVDGIVEKIAGLEGIKHAMADKIIMGRTVTIHLTPPTKQKSKKQELGRTAKEIEILWKVTDEELEKKRFRVEELLTAGVPVDLIITAKRKVFEISEEHGNQVLTKILAQMKQIPQIHEVKPRTGTPGRTLTLYLGTGPDQEFGP